MNINQQQKNWLLDAGLWVGFVAAFFLELTGVELHQWLGVGLGLLAGLHLAWHWKWIKAVTQRLMGKTTPQARIYYLLDAGILGGFVTILASGLAISTWLDLPSANYPVWRDVHVAGSITTLVLVAAKIGLHWRWIVKTTRDMLRDERIPASTLALQPARATARVSRRHFLSVMSLVGISAGAALLNISLPGMEASTVDGSGAQSSTSGSQSPVVAVLPSSPSSGSSSSTACRVRCNKRCSYPGHCRRYVDSDQNGKCDLGECV